jgi:hypothetical protein
VPEDAHRRAVHRHRVGGEQDEARDGRLSGGHTRREDQVAGADVLEVAEKSRVRGAVERGYRLRQESASVDAETLAALTADDHRRAFTVAMASLIAEFSGYLDQGGAEPVADLVGHRQHGVWLSREELVGLTAAMQQAIVPLHGNEPTPIASATC